VYAQIVLSTLGTISGMLRIAGFPFPIGGDSAMSVGYFATFGVSMSGAPLILARGGSSHAEMYYVPAGGSGGVTAATQSTLANTSYIIFSGTYISVS
jgi:hypothetical protein